jgi:hypothetical protein
MYEVRRYTFSRTGGRYPLTALPRPTARRPTPIATTALPFSVRLGPEGAMEMRLMA